MVVLYLLYVALCQFGCCSHLGGGGGGAGCFAWFVFLVSRGGWAALPRGVAGLSAVCDCGIPISYSLIIFNIQLELSTRVSFHVFGLFTANDR